MLLATLLERVQMDVAIKDLDEKESLVVKERVT